MTVISNIQSTKNNACCYVIIFLSTVDWFLQWGSEDEPTRPARPQGPFPREYRVARPPISEFLFIHMTNSKEFDPQIQVYIFMFLAAQVGKYE
jgi:hypothetical protein